MQFTQNKDRPQKRHAFEYREKLKLETQQKFNSADDNTKIKTELNLVTQLGCWKKDYNKFLENRFKLMSEAEDKKKIMTREKEKLEEIQRLSDQEKVLAKSALQHVSSLKAWEKNNLPKIEVKK